MASEKVSLKMVLEIKYVNAVEHTENSKLLLDLKGGFHGSAHVSKSF